MKQLVADKAFAVRGSGKERERAFNFFYTSPMAKFKVKY
jgi:hypothetical protein